MLVAQGQRLLRSRVAGCAAWLLGALSLLLLTEAHAQVPYLIRGRVIEAGTGQPIPSVTVRASATATSKSTTDSAGIFKVDFSSKPTGWLTFEATGFKSMKEPIPAVGTQLLTVRLMPAIVRLKQAEVVGTVGQADPEQALRSGQMGETVLTMEALRVLPVLFGEADPVKTLAYLPGVQTGGEGQTGLYVRGGSQDQNLTLLDGATIYNAGHLLNFFSVFNADAVSTVSLLKTPEARYGGRLSSVLRVESRAGSADSLRTCVGLGLIASRLSVEGPIGRRRVDSAAGPRPTFLVTARRTYLDVLAKPFLREDQRGVPYYFYDLNGQLTWRPSLRDKLTLTLYHGRDAGSFKLAGGRLRADFHWGNAVGALNWRHAFRPNLRLLATTTATDYRFHFDSHFDIYITQLLTYVRDYAGQAELTWEPVPRHHLALGLSATTQTLRPRAGDAATDDGQSFRTTRVQTKYAQLVAGWLTDEWALTDRLLLSGGLRFSGQRQRGPYTRYWFDAPGARVVDSVTYPAGTTAARFATLEPRMNARFALPGDRASVKVAYTRTAQYQHLVSQTTSALPLDVWVPASDLTPPQRAHNYSAGYFRNFGPNQEWQVSVEGYYRALRGQLEYRDGYVAGPANRDLEYEFVRGAGRAWGVELLTRRMVGPLQGWVAYTLAWARRQFPELNGGAEFPFRFDQRHNLNVVTTYELTPRWRLGATFTYATGQAITMPERRYILENDVQYQYGPRNGFRMATQHRLDLAATWQRPARRWGHTQWQFSVYNAYGRRNPWFYYLEPSGNVTTGSARITARAVSLFPYPVPAVTWELCF